MWFNITIHHPPPATQPHTDTGSSVCISGHLKTRHIYISPFCLFHCLLTITKRCVSQYTIFPDSKFSIDTCSDPGPGSNMASESISICINVVSLQCREKIFEHVLHILLVSASAHFLLFERHKQESSPPLYLHHMATCGSNDELTSGAWSRCPQQPINPPVLATRQTLAPAANMSRVPATLGAASHQLHCSDIIECSPSVNEHSNIILLLSYILVKVYNGQLMRNATMCHYDCHHYRCHDN